VIEIHSSSVSKNGSLNAEQISTAEYKSLAEKASKENVTKICLVFIVNNVDGVRGVAKSVSSGMPAIGLEY
jgi:hypothetical protein